MRTALITGLTGQDGSLLARDLLARGYRVVGGVRRSAPADMWRLRELGLEGHESLALVRFDLMDPDAARRAVGEAKPDEVYNLAGQTSVVGSFAEPLLTAQAVAMATLQLLEAIRLENPKIRFFQACSAEMYGIPATSPQDEDTPMNPRTPYGAAKAYAHWICNCYRESFGIFACSGILFNHESPWRSLEFVTRKITDSVAKIRLEQLDCLHLGRLDAWRDWGYAPEYVDAMRRILQVPEPASYVLATGRAASIREFARMAFKAAGIRIEFRGAGAEETALDPATGRTVIRVDPKLFRPVDATQLVGDASRASAILGWQASRPLEQICTEMVEFDLRRNSSLHSTS